MMDETNKPARDDAPEGDKTSLMTPKKIAESIYAAVKWQKKGLYEKDDARWRQWERNKKYLMCIWPDSQEDDVNVNTVRSNYQTKKPTLFFRNPKVQLVPTKPQFTRDMYGNVVKGENGHPILLDNYVAARIGSVKLNYELREMKFKKLVRKVTGDNLCPYGIGWGKVGFSRLSVGGHDNDRDTSYTYWIQRVDPRNLVYDWMATDIDNVRFIHERLILTRQDAEEYEIELPENYVCQLPDFLKDRSKSSKNKDTDSDLVILWESHDLKNRMIYWTFAGDKEGSDASQAKDTIENPYPFEGSCYVPLVLNEDNDDIIGLSDVEPVEDQAKAINKLRTKQTKHMEWYGTKTVYEDGAIEPSEIEKTKKTDHGIYQKINKGFSGMVKEVSPPSVGQDSYAMINEHKEDIRTTLGITEFQQGSAGAASTKATTANIVSNASNNRIEEGRDAIKDFVIECCRRLFAMIQKFSGEEEYLNLKDEVMDEDFVGVLKKQYGYDPKIPFLRMSRDDIQGEFNFEFNVEDMIIQPKEIQAQQFNNWMAAVFSNQVITQKFVEEFDIGKVLKKSAELVGIDLGELKKGGPVQLGAETENQMFANGMEVPEPHPKDHDDEHIISHGRLEKEFESQLQQGQQQAQQLMMMVQQMQAQQMQAAAQAGQVAEQAGQMAQMQGQVPPQPQTPPEIPPEIQQQLDQLTEQMNPIQNILRKIKLHRQWHDMSRRKKEMSASYGGQGGMGQQPQGQPAASMQAQMQGQANSIQ